MPSSPLARLFGLTSRPAVQSIAPRRTFKDVILPPATRRALDNALAQVTQHDLIFNRWGLAERHPTGQALAFFSGHEVIGVDAVSGRQLWMLPWKTLWDLNAADPIVFENKMFVSSGNGVGCAQFDLTAEPLRELWRNKNLKTLMNSAVLWQGVLFGFNDDRLSCLDWSTGEERWSTTDVRKGSLILADGKLVLLSETGRLVVAEAKSSAYRPVAHAQILEGRCWTTPVLSDGLLFARNAAGDVVCLSLRKPGHE